MKQKGKKLNLLFLVIISIFFISLFNLSSFAATCDLPGDFVGPMGDPIPDGKVDFNDLMVFATAYGSETGDPNWNALCDICGYLGDPNLDGKINFDDLMIFATNYGKVCPSATWTVMVYMDGDNSLDYNAWDDLSEMESVGSNNEINIVTQLDLYSSYSGTYRYYVTGVAQGVSYPLYPDDIVQTLPEQNMADPATLTAFVNWATLNYPAEKYLLVIWNHGAGWREYNTLTKGVVFDDTSGDYLTMAELVQGLNGINEKIDIISFDACLMQMIEVAYEISGLINVPNYMVASQASEWGDGWPYDDILAHLTSNPAMDEATLCDTIVNDFINYCGPVGTLSTFDFSTFDSNTIQVINSFATALMASSYQNEIATARSSAQSYSYSSGYRCKDFFDFAERIYNNVLDCQDEALAVMNQINNLVLFENHAGSGVADSRGLSIYLPDDAGEYDNDYNDLQFAIDTQWDEFLQYSSISINPPSVTTLPADNITSTSARFHGSIDATGGEEPFAGGFEYGLKSIGLGIKEEKYGVGNYYADVTGLIPETTYEFRIWAENSAGRTYGSYLEFTTEIISSVVRRALLVGVGDYLYGDNDLPAPPYDVDKMHDTINHSGDGFALINELKDWDATKSAILNGIANTFSQADEDDISYFYFSGHGGLLENISYLIPTDFDGYTSTCISVSELESTLSAIPGIKVVFLDSCHSGGFIGKEINYKDIANYLKYFNDDIINTFMTKDLANSQYQVLTSCLSIQTALELLPSEGDPFGLFSAVLCEGCGYNYYTHPYWADANANGEITLNEAYLYTDEQVNLIIDILNAPPYEWGVDQDTQVYPEDSNFVIIEE